MARGEDQEVAVFSMSFLDVFCCTVGALIFILFIQVLRTRDMVERQELESTLAKLEEADRIYEQSQHEYEKLQEDIETAKTEKARLAKDLEQLTNKVATLEQEVSTKDDTIEDLITQLTQDEPALDANGTGTDATGPQLSETVSKEWRDPLLANLERKIITCGEDRVYLGTSRMPIRIADTNDFNGALVQFMRYYNEETEHLWWHRLANSERSYQAALSTVNACRSSWGEGLNSASEKQLPDLSRAEKGKLEIDADGDGVTEALYTASADGKRWINKSVDVYMPLDYEERFGDYDEASGKWKTKDVNTDGDSRYDLRLVDVNLTDQDWESCLVYDGTATRLDPNQCLFKYTDDDNDGVYDKKMVESDPGNTKWEAQYTAFSKEHKRWAEYNIANPTNSFWQTAYLDSNLTNDMWEAKWVDLDGDGKYDVRWQDENDKDWDWEALYSKPLVRDGKWIWREKLQDSTGNGKWDKRYLDFDGDDSWEVAYLDTNGNGKWNEKWTKKNKTFWEERLIDDDGDGEWDKKMTDEDIDGKWDAEYAYDSITRKWVKKGT